ncbi:uncharacterized protein LOC111861621 isoform X2 [Cryptotermes secundus]|uniref:uncharacterized protein LOC111861621 isoform X2 n=1 Tax=Cryptotermes secundus TaxID=105785 RepID=UPI001454DCDA|nr:uncharacterized protein LOC111861621 isoform X2 [Cryptotermes secundus]
MAGVPVPGYQAFWAGKRAALQAEFKEIIMQYPDAKIKYKRLFDILCSIEDVAGFTTAAIGESAEWAAIVSAADDNRINYCKALSGKTLFSALYGNYTVTLNELKSLIKASASGTIIPARVEGFKEVRRRKRQSTAEFAPTPKKTTAAVERNPKTEVATKIYFAPLREATMETDTSGAEATTLEEETIVW